MAWDLRSWTRDQWTGTVASVDSPDLEATWYLIVTPATKDASIDREFCFLPSTAAALSGSESSLVVAGLSAVLVPAPPS